MTNLFKELAGLNRLIHEPARLSILTALSTCKSADFIFLQRITSLSSGNLSSHLTKLERAELIQIEKHFVGKRPQTRVNITNEGRIAIENHWRELENLRERANSWKPKV